MTLLYRRLTYGIFIIIFLILAPVVVLYTAGYRYNFTKGRVQKTGILTISSNPRGAGINLNGQLVKQTTPAKIEKILPGDYEIQLTLPGYHSWQKKLPIYENSTAFAEKINLWLLATSSPLTAIKAETTFVSSDQKKLALLTNKKELWVFDQATEKNIFLGQLNNYTEVKINDWSADANLILMAVKSGAVKDFYVFNYQNGSRQKLVNKNFTSVKWDKEKSTILYGLNSQGLWTIDISAQTTKLIDRLAATAFYLNGSKLYYLNGRELRLKTLGDGAPGQLIENLPDADFTVKDQKKNRLFLLNETAHSLAIIDLDRQNKTILTSADKFSWLNDNLMLFYNDWEIFIYDLNKPEPELITRWGEKISSVLWHPQGKHIIFASENKIKIIELDNRELRNIIDLDSGAQAQEMLLDNRSQNLYYAGSYNGADGIFKLRLQ